MKTTFIDVYVPTRGKKGLSSCLEKSISSGIKYFTKQFPDHTFRVFILVTIKRGKEDFDYDPVNKNFKVIYSDIRGKTNILRHFVNLRKCDFHITLDDDVRFDEKFFLKAYKYLLKHEEINLVSYQTAAVPFIGTSKIKEFQYKVLNCRSLHKLYKDNRDPFLIGRFLFFRGPEYPVPQGILSDDMFLTAFLWNKYKILDDYVYYLGLDSFRKHVKRMIVHRSSYLQVIKEFPELSRLSLTTVKRRVDFNKVNNLSIINKVYFYLFTVVQFISYKIVPLFIKHNGESWEMFSLECGDHVQVNNVAVEVVELQSE